MEVELAAAPPYVRISTPHEVPAALSALGIPGDRPILVSLGGAGKMDAEDGTRAEGLIRNCLVPALERHRATVVDGGTDSGVMRIMGRARTELGARFPLLGVAAEGTVRLPGSATVGTDVANLEPGHTGVIIVPGDAWGEESPWIADIAGQLAGSRASATLVINGGQVTYQDVEYSLARRRPVLVVKGTGRTADAIAGAMADRGASGSSADRAALIAASPLVVVVPLEDPVALTTALDATFYDVGI